MTAIDLGNIVTAWMNVKGDPVSPKKLQKLLYYVEAWNLVHLEEPLLDESFEAWVHGPVLPSLYRDLKSYGFNNIEVINNEEASAGEFVHKIAKKNNLSHDQLDLIESVLRRYSHFTSYELEMLSHSEDPWLDARGDVPPHERCRTVISKEAMKAYYSAQLQKA